MNADICNKCRKELNNRKTVDEDTTTAFCELNDIFDTDVGWWCPVARKHVYRDSDETPMKCLYTLEHLMEQQHAITE